MNIIDAHHHLWNPISNDPEVGYVWLKELGKLKPFGDPTNIQRDYLIDEFLDELNNNNEQNSKEHRIVSSVHIQADGRIEDPVKETAWIDTVIRNQPNHRIMTVGFLDLTSPACKPTLERHLRYPHFKGIRQIIAYLPHRPELSFCKENYLTNNVWRNNYRWYSESNLSFDLQLYPEQMAEATDFFCKFTNPIIIDHAGSPYDQSLNGFKKWEKGLEYLAHLENCAIKLSGWGMYDQHWSSASLKDWYDVIYQLFTPEKMMFGSNYPVDKLMKPYEEIVEETLKLIKGSKHNNGPKNEHQEVIKEVNDIFFQTANKIYFN